MKCMCLNVVDRPLPSPPLALLTELDEYTQVEPVLDANGEDAADSGREADPVPWGRLMRLSGGSAIALMPRPEQPQGRALNEVTLGRGKVSNHRHLFFTLL